MKIIFLDFDGVMDTSYYDHILSKEGKPGNDEYGTELAQRDKKIEDLKDSIRVLQVKLGVYEKAVKWFREADNDELQRGIEQIRSVPKDVPLP